MRGCVSKTVASRISRRAGSVPSACARFVSFRKTLIFRSTTKIRAARFIGAWTGKSRARRSRSNTASRSRVNSLPSSNAPGPAGNRRSRDFKPPPRSSWPWKLQSESHRVAKSIYFVAGEASADNHGAALMESLRRLDLDLRFRARGGPRMQAIAGENFKNWVGEAAVVVLWEVIKRYGYFQKQFRETLREIAETKPDAVVLIDYPGFNLRLARALRARARAPKIVYYISPQVWAWNRGRIKQMARCLDLMLCIFPFEADLYNQSGLRTIFVGHPMIDNLRAHKIDIERNPNLIGLFPGSRSPEVRKIFPILIEAARKLRERKPNLRFEVAAAAEQVAGEIRDMLDATPHLNPLPSPRGEGRVRGDLQFISIKVDETAGLMQRAFAG